MFLWPTSGRRPTRSARSSAESIDPELFRRTYAVVFEGDERWRALPIPAGDRYAWDPTSTYVAKPPFFDGLSSGDREVGDIIGARVLAVLGDSVTTDHISPAGSIAPWSPAGQWLQEHGVAPLEFNSYGARRGHHEVMMRGTFGNIRLRNRLVEGKEGPYTVHLPSGERDVHLRRRDALPDPRASRCSSLAGREYGSGSSRDWAAKGPVLLGVKAVLAESYERIHRSNLVGMGVLPLQYKPGDSASSLGLDGPRDVHVLGLVGGPLAAPLGDGRRRRATTAATVRFEAIARLDGPIEVDYYRGGGILPAVLRRLASGVLRSPSATRATASGPARTEALGGGPRASSRRRMSRSDGSTRRWSERVTRIDPVAPGRAA